jgi:hypothetical protein
MIEYRATLYDRTTQEVFEKKIFTYSPMMARQRMVTAIVKHGYINETDDYYIEVAPWEEGE